MCIRDRCKNFENWLRFDKVTKSLKVGTFFETQCICLSHRHLFYNVRFFAALLPENYMQKQLLLLVLKTVQCVVYQYTVFCLLSSYNDRRPVIVICYSGL